MINNTHEELKNEIEEIKKQLTVTVINGKKMEKPLNEAVAEIWEHTIFLRDVNKTHWTFKKYKVYKIIAGLLGLTVLFHMGMSFKDLLLKFLN